MTFFPFSRLFGHAARCLARRGGLFSLLVLAGWLRALAPAAAAPVVLYSNINAGHQASAECAVVLACGGVYQPSRATDADLNNYALLYTNTVAAVRLRLTLSGTAAAGSRAGLVVANGTGLLNVQALGDVRLRTLLNGVVQETRLLDVAVARGALQGQARPSQLEFITNLAFNQVELEIDGASLTYVARVFYAYGATVNRQETVTGYVSRFGSTAGNFSTAGSTGSGPVVVCANTDVDHPERAADADLSNYASFGSLATVACPSTLRVRLEGTAPAGYFAGFVVGGAGLLDLNALGGLRIRTFRNGVAQESVVGLNALQLTALPNGQTQVSFRSTLPFDEVSIERVGAVSALDNLRLYYGFGVEPRTFLASTAALSNFADPAGHSEASFSAALCVGCSVGNAASAADANTGSTSYASLNVPVGVLSTLGLRLDLTTPGAAGNRAGIVLAAGSGLLDAGALNALIINTYDAAGYLLESRRGSSLLQVALLPDGRQEVFFNTTRPFASVEIEVAHGVAALLGTRVYYAFADDRPTGFPTTITPAAPLPVELTAFAGCWTKGAALLTWRTATERHNQGFTIERSLGGESSYSAVGQVVAGSQNGPHSYSFADNEAAAQHAQTLYYRLRQRDDDGRETVSKVVPVAVGQPAAVAFALYPNPAPVAGATLLLGTADASRVVRVYAATGGLVCEVAAPAPTTELPLAGFAPGVYQVQVAGSTAVAANLRLQVLE